MLVYEKKVAGVRKLFGTHDNIPADTDAKLVYKDGTGTVIPLVDNDTYVDDTHGGIKRKSDDKAVNVFIGTDTEAIIPKGWVAPAVEVKEEPKKKVKKEVKEEIEEELKEEE